MKAKLSDNAAPTKPSQKRFSIKINQLLNLDLDFPLFSFILAFVRKAKQFKKEISDAPAKGRLAK